MNKNELNFESIKDPTCSFGSPCDFILKCDCNKDFGSDDCSVKLNNGIQFELVETCCDIRRMNCDEIAGVGPKFSNNNTLYYQIDVVYGSV